MKGGVRMFRVTGGERTKHIQKISDANDHAEKLFAGNKNLRSVIIERKDDDGNWIPYKTLRRKEDR